MKFAFSSICLPRLLLPFVVYNHWTVRWLHDPRDSRRWCLTLMVEFRPNDMGSNVVALLLVPTAHPSSWTNKCRPVHTFALDQYRWSKRCLWMSLFDYWSRTQWDEPDRISDRNDCVRHRLLSDSMANHRQCTVQKGLDRFDWALAHKKQPFDAQHSAGTRISNNFQPIWNFRKKNIWNQWIWYAFDAIFIFTCVMMPLISFCMIFGRHIFWMSSRKCSFNVNVEPVFTPIPNFSAMYFSASGLNSRKRKSNEFIKIDRSKATKVSTYFNTSTCVDIRILRILIAL